MARGKREAVPAKVEYSKKAISDIRPLLWIVTIGGLLLAAYAIHENYMGALPWISTMVGLPWAAHGTVCSFYMNMAKSDHKEGGITFETAKANNFNATVTQAEPPSVDSPAI